MHPAPATESAEWHFREVDYSVFLRFRRNGYYCLPAITNNQKLTNFRKI